MDGNWLTLSPPVRKNGVCPFTFSARHNKTGQTRSLDSLVFPTFASSGQTKDAGLWQVKQRV
jgi:hypothetical protein